ncbi:hypothetical protein BC830DRAFT_1107731 [Chytriomyces sp. MP71]|nr:hypothetical protein BC830DRAFT_1107731 [Chytriomyces sp. MP71]
MRLLHQLPLCHTRHRDMPLVFEPLHSRMHGALRARHRDKCNIFRRVMYGARARTTGLRLCARLQLQHSRSGECRMCSGRVQAGPMCRAICVQHKWGQSGAWNNLRAACQCATEWSVPNERQLCSSFEWSRFLPEWEMLSLLQSVLRFLQRGRFPCGWHNLSGA